MRPYLAVFAATFQLMLQYRAAAIAGFVTQCWWGAIRVMVYAAFYAGPAGGAAPLGLAQAITYTWLSQALLVLLPWTGDPVVAEAVKTGNIAHDRLRPLDTYSWWFARAAASLIARALPRAALMLLLAGAVLPAAGLGAWAWRPPAGIEAALCFALSLGLAALLSASIVVLINVKTAAFLSPQGNALIVPLVVVLSGNVAPLSFYPGWLQGVLFLQPCASLLDIPCRLYLGSLAGRAALAGLAAQGFWVAAFVLLGRSLLERTMARLAVQGG